MDEKLAIHIANYINTAVDRVRENPTVVIMTPNFINAELILSAVRAYEKGTE
jgi:hypothetical protein